MNSEQTTAPRTAALFQRIQLCIQNDGPPRLVYALIAELIRTAAGEMELPEEVVRERLMGLIREHGQRMAV